MDPWKIFPLISGYESVDGHLRLYVDGPTPAPNFTRSQGARTPLFHLYAEADAEAILVWLAHNRAWQCLRVPPEYRAEWGVRAILLASDWHCGEASALFRLATTRTIHDDTDRQQLQCEVRLLIASVLENPVRLGEFEDLQFLEDVINTAPVAVELATPAQVVDGFLRVLR